jgi:filamentous hemagglutinin family protein
VWAQIVGVTVVALSSVTHAEVTLDGTLGPAGAIEGPNYNYVIPAEVGQQRGDNLFHSFGRFSIETLGSATFTGPSTIANVIGRVTGGQSSWIDGALRSDIPSANLYLLNPAGVAFGPNATLDVKGSFHVSTADYLRLGDGGVFHATQPQASGLTSAPPSAFGFLDDHPASISIIGSRHYWKLKNVLYLVASFVIFNR